jgi:hypothetical protein
MRIFSTLIKGIYYDLSIKFQTISLAYAFPFTFTFLNFVLHLQVIMSKSVNASCVPQKQLKYFSPERFWRDIFFNFEPFFNII